MKAVIATEFGAPEVLKIKEVDKPVPKNNEILVRIHATSVNYGDLTARKFKYVSPREFNMPFLFWIMARIYFGLGKPNIKIPGSEFSGEVEAVGRDVARFKAGDQVFGYRGEEMGAYAEYLAMPADGVVTIKPGTMSHEEAAVLPSGGITAVHILGKLNIMRGQKILINGASGGIGSVALQYAKYCGAEVTGVCGTPRLEYVKSLGADRVFDYTKEDFTDRGETYDIIFDVLGRSSFGRCRGSLNENGRYVLASFKMIKLLQMLWTKIAGGKKVLCVLSPQGREALEALRELTEAGKVRSVIDRRFPLERVVDAHRYVEEGARKGYVAITVS